MVALDEHPKFKDQWIQAMLLVESFKLVPKAFRQGSKTKNWQIEAKPVLERKSISADQTNSAKRRVPYLIWRTKNQPMDQGTLQLKD
jgi:hypothetical protein